MHKFATSILLASTSVYANNQMKLAVQHPYELFLDPARVVEHQELTSIDINTVAPC